MPRTATPAFTSSNTDIETLLWKISGGELVGATHGRRQIFKVAFQFVAVGTFYPIVFSLASLGERFVNGTSTYLVIFQTTAPTHWEQASRRRKMKRRVFGGRGAGCGGRG
jgi:hypothetical protein